MIDPDWLKDLETEDPGCREGLRIGLPPGCDDPLEDVEEPGIHWCWNQPTHGLVELECYGPPPDPAKVGFSATLTSWPTVRFYVARGNVGLPRAGVVVDRLMAETFANVRHIIPFPGVRKYVETWIRCYYPLMSLVLECDHRPEARGISLVWSQPYWAARPHWILSRVLPAMADFRTREAAITITTEPKFRELLAAHRNLIREHQDYMTVKGQIRALPRVGLESMKALADLVSEKFTPGNLPELIDSLFEPGPPQPHGPRSTSFRKPDLYRGFERPIGE